MPKVIVGMSGGVDSAVAAYLLKVAGYDVIGVTLKIWYAADGKESRCCEIDDAQKVSALLGIPYYAINHVADFRKWVTEPFIESYIHGFTPNPCIGCNRYIKWDGMLSAAHDLGADHIATGHYAQIVQLENGRYSVKQSLHPEKDQTYMLYMLTQEQLKATIMPLGKLTKDEVRNMAKAAGLPVAEKPDSQEICFVPDGSYAEYIEENYTGEIPSKGNFVDEDGNILGQHSGIINYTVGQRRGLGIALGYPAFVKRIDAERNEVVIGTDEQLYSRTVICGNVNYMGAVPLSGDEKLHCRTKIRYHHPAAVSTIERIDDNTIRIVFDEPVRAAAPGQSAVFYDDDMCVLGGGMILSAE